MIKLLAAVICLSLPSVAWSQKALKFALPPASPVADPASARCQTVVTADLRGFDVENPRSALSEDGNSVYAQVEEGTDVLSVQIEGSALYFMSGAGFRAGEAKGSEFQIVNNSPELLLAVTGEGGRTIDVFALNKTTGLAVWTKTRSVNLFGGSPTVQAHYMTCK